MSIKGFVLAIISGAITSGLGYVLWYTVLPSLKTTIAAVLQLTVPIIAAIVGVLFFSEELTMELVFAAILVAMGTFVSLINKPSQ
jgi:drug/metabolite transporter (DMT)-like permease